MESSLITKTAEEVPAEINFDAFITALQKQKPEAAKLTLDKVNCLRIVDVKGVEIQSFDFTRFDGVEQFFGLADSVMTVE